MHRDPVLISRLGILLSYTLILFTPRQVDDGGEAEDIESDDDEETEAGDQEVDLEDDTGAGEPEDEALSMDTSETVASRGKAFLRQNDKLYDAEGILNPHVRRAEKKRKKKAVRNTQAMESDNTVEAMTG